MNNKVDSVELENVRSNADLLYTAAQLDEAIVEMGRALNRLVTSDDEVLIVCVMNGGVVLAGKLLPLLNFDLTFEGINASRYRERTTGSDIEWKYQGSGNPEGKLVVLIDDILDEGLTLAAVKQSYIQRGAKDVICAVLVDKDLGRQKPLEADIVGVRAENRYLFGYGMDYKGYLRNAAGLYACESVK